VLKGILPTSVFSWLKNLTFVQNSLFQEYGRSTATLVREECMLQAGRSSTMFLKENGVTFLKEYCIPLSVFMGVEYYLCAK
jgi:hypothetical protein